MPSRPSPLEPPFRRGDRHPGQPGRPRAGERLARRQESPRRTLDEKLDEALEQTFPASDPFFLL